MFSLGAGFYSEGGAKRNRKLVHVRTEGIAARRSVISGYGKMNRNPQSSMVSRFAGRGIVLKYDEPGRIIENRREPAEDTQTDLTGERVAS